MWTHVKHAAAHHAMHTAAEKRPGTLVGMVVGGGVGGIVGVLVGGGLLVAPSIRLGVSLGAVVGWVFSPTHIR